MKKVLIFLVIIAIVIGTFIAFLPTLTRTHWGKEQLLAQINQSINGRLDAEELSATWSQGIIAKGLTIKDAKGNLVFKAQQASLEAPLHEILEQRIVSSEIINGEGTLTYDEKGVTNFDQIFQKKQQTGSLASIPFSNFYVKIQHDNDQTLIKLEGQANFSDLNSPLYAEMTTPSLKGYQWKDLQIQLINGLVSQKVAFIGEASELPVSLLPHGEKFLENSLKIKIDNRENPQNLNFILLSSNFLMGGHVDLKKKWENSLINFSVQGQLNNLETIEEIRSLPPLFGTKAIIDFECKEMPLSAFKESADFDFPFSLKVIGLNGEGFIKGNVRKGETVLKEPLKLEITNWSPSMQKWMNQHKIPFFNAISRIEDSITLVIEPNGTALTLADLKNSRLGKASLDLKKVYLLNKGEIAALLNIIHPMNESEYFAWFTPLFFDLHEGLLKLKRFDCLIANAYQLACWGEMNLRAQKSIVMVGLTAQALEYAFQLKNLPEDYVLPIPIKEKKGRLEIDKKEVLARISTLLPGKHKGGAAQLLGDLMGLVSPGKPVPPPTTTPFPWDAIKD